MRMVLPKDHIDIGRRHSKYNQKGCHQAKYKTDYQNGFLNFILKDHTCPKLKQI